MLNLPGSNISCDEVGCDKFEPIDLDINQHFLRAEYNSDLEEEGWYFTNEKHYCPDCGEYYKREALGEAYESDRHDRFKQDQLDDQQADHER